MDERSPTEGFFSVLEEEITRVVEGLDLPRVMETGYFQSFMILADADSVRVRVHFAPNVFLELRCFRADVKPSQLSTLRLYFDEKFRIPGPPGTEALEIEAHLTVLSLIPQDAAVSALMTAMRDPLWNLTDAFAMSLLTESETPAWFRNWAFLSLDSTVENRQQVGAEPESVAPDAGGLAIAEPSPLRWHHDETSFNLRRCNRRTH